WPVWADLTSCESRSFQRLRPPPRGEGIVMCVTAQNGHAVGLRLPRQRELAPGICLSRSCEHVPMDPSGSKLHVGRRFRIPASILSRVQVVHLRVDRAEAFPGEYMSVPRTKGYEHPSRV